MNEILITQKDGTAPSCLTLTVKQLAEIMQVSMPTAYAMTEQRGFPVLRVGKKKLIPLALLTKWLEEQTRED